MSDAGNRRSSPIAYHKLSYTALVDLAQNPAQVAALRAAAGHPDVVPGVRSEEEASVALENLRSVNRRVESAGRKSGDSVFVRGRIMRHKPSGRKVTLIRCSANSKTHEVIDAKAGKRFLAHEKDLRELS